MFNGPVLTENDLKSLQEFIRNKNFSIKDRKGVIYRFEEDFRRYHDRKYAIVMNSGTAAIHSAYNSIDLKKNDEVIMPAFGWHACVSPLLIMGAKPVFCEIDKYYNIDASKIESRITDKTRCIFVLHNFGHPAQMNKILEIADRYGLKIIEDCSHSIGARFEGKRVGTFGDIAISSLQQSKPISGGEGGVLITDNPEYYDRAIVLGHPGRKTLKEQKTRNNLLSLGFKYRANPFSIAIALTQLKKINRLNEKRREAWDYIFENLKDSAIELPATDQRCIRGGFFGFKLRYLKDEMTIPFNRFIEELLDRTTIFEKEGSMILSKIEQFRDLDDQDQITLDTENKVHGIISIAIPRILTKKTKEIIDYDIDIINNLLRRYQVKKSSNRYEVDIDKIMPKLYLEITKRCNLDCLHCYQKTARSMAELEEASSEEIMSIIKDTNPNEIIITGGEPFIRKDIMEILREIDNGGYNFQIYTNGTLITENIKNELLGFKNLKKIVISIDGPEKVHNKIRGEGYFNKIVKLVNDMKGKIPVLVPFTLQENNFRDITKILDLSYELATECALMPEHFIDKFNIDDTIKKLGVSRKEIILEIKSPDKRYIEFVNDGLMELMRYQGVGINVQLPSFFWKERCNKFYEIGKDRFECKSLTTPHIRVNSEGQMVFCQRINYILGDLKKKNFRQIMKSETFKTMRDKIVSNMQGLYLCKTCCKARFE